MNELRDHYDRDIRE